MKNILSFSVFILILSLNTFSQVSTVNLGTTTVETRSIYTSIGLPWELKYGPGDSLWMTTREGMVYRIDPENGAATLLLNHTASVATGGEAGMLGMAFHNNFSANPFVYIAYTYSSSGIKVRLSRFSYSGNALSNETILLQNIAGNTTHDGSRLVMLPDNTILMTTGDAQNLASAQDTFALTGKVLRLNLDGSIPSNNPFPNSYVYSLGHRNGQGLFLHPNGKIYETEHGPNSNDEFQIIEPGRNYGWPTVYGFCDNDINGETTFCTANNVKEPLASWNPVPGETWAPSDLTWYSSGAIPEFQNTFLVSFLKTAKLRRVQLNAAGDAVVAQSDFFVNQFGRLRDVTSSPTGDIFLATNSSPFRIIRVRNLSVLPVQILSTNISCNNLQTQINFTIKGESNISKYLIYGSNDGQQFSLLGSLGAQGSGNSSEEKSYNLKVESTFRFFKIMAQNIDGSINDNPVIKNPCIQKGIFNLYPNPAKETATLNMNAISEPVLVQVYNATGVRVYSNRTSNSVALPITKWSKGLYFVTVSDGNNAIVYKEKLLVK